MTIDLTARQKAVVTRAKHDKSFEEKAKMAIADRFHLPTHKHVNLEKALIYLNYLKTDQHKLDMFLDSLSIPTGEPIEKDGEDHE